MNGGTATEAPFFSVYIYYVCAHVFICHQVQYELSQATEKLQGEEAQRQQLSEEFEQVQPIIIPAVAYCKCC